MEIREFARFSRAQEIFYTSVAESVPETYERFLITNPSYYKSETNKWRFLNLAFQLKKVLPRQRKKEFKKILKEIQEAIREEVRRDGPEVMNMVGVLQAVRKNEKEILRLAEEMPERLKKARQEVLQEFPGMNSLTDEKMYDKFVWEFFLGESFFGDEEDNKE